ncbi:MAG: hypothetical protein KKF62_02010 [Bacteroidetes bacterium]|nr:hypothetical protein [Bacteroidota bacterium]MBU1115339.1 hypothetical protein [Bacteroidota bacterium]MBU1799672.1 hypothetical protein [Bacteroidota bacterium]
MEATKKPISLLDALFQVFNAQVVSLNDNANILKHQKTISDSVEKQRNIKKSSIVALVNFLGCSTENEFQEIYGESLGSHLWAKFYNNGKYSYNFLTEVSNHNLIILENYLKKGDY